MLKKKSILLIMFFAGTNISCQESKQQTNPAVKAKAIQLKINQNDIVPEDPEDPEDQQQTDERAEHIKADLFNFYESNDTDYRVHTLTGSTNYLTQINYKDNDKLVIEKLENNNWIEHQTIDLKNCNNNTAQFINSFPTNISFDEYKSKMLVAIAYKSQEQIDNEEKNRMYDSCLFLYEKNNEKWDLKEYINTEKELAKGENALCEGSKVSPLFSNSVIFTGWLSNSDVAMYTSNQNKEMIVVRDFYTEETCRWLTTMLNHGIFNIGKNQRSYEDGTHLLYDFNSYQLLEKHVDGSMYTYLFNPPEQIDPRDKFIYMKVDAYNKTESVDSGICRIEATKEMYPCVRFKIEKSSGIHDYRYHEYKDLKWSNDKFAEVFDKKTKESKLGQVIKILSLPEYNYATASLNQETKEIIIDLVTKKDKEPVKHNFYKYELDEFVEANSTAEVEDKKIKSIETKEEAFISNHQQWYKNKFYYNFIEEKSITDKGNYISGIKELDLTANKN